MGKGNNIDINDKSIKISRIYIIKDCYVIFQNIDGFISAD